MLPVVFRLDFFGGPQDGLCVYSRAVPDTRLLFPVGREMDLQAVTAHCRIDDTTAAIYKFDHAEVFGRLPNCLPVLEYRFVGFTTPSRLRQRQRCQTTRRGLIGRVTTKCRRVLRRFRDWWIEPVAYPLQINFPSPAASDCRDRQRV